MHIALFNGFPHHFEVFGGFIEYCRKNEHELTIFTCKHNNNGWFSFYQFCFSPYSFQIREVNEFTEKEYAKYDAVIVTTDDDFHFSDHNMNWPNANNKIIAYDHYYTIRRHAIKKRIAIRPYLTTRPELKVFYPIYEMISKQEKLELLRSSSQTNIVIVGCPDNNADFLKYLDLKNTNITYIRRTISAQKKQDFQLVCPSIQFKENLPTEPMIDAIKRAHYIFLCTDNQNYTHYATSGAIGMAFSAGCQIIMPRKNNTEYQFKSVLYFEDSPSLENPDLDAVFKEREEILSKNYINLDNVIHETYGSNC